MSRAEWRAERLRTALRSQPMFRGLAPAELARLEAIAALRDFDRGAPLWSAGDPPEALTLIVSGRVKVVRHGPGGDVILEIFGAGEQVGAIAVYEGIPYPASAIAMEPSAVVFIPRRDYFDLLDRHPELARGIIRELTRLTLSLTRRLEETRGQRVEARIANLFLTLADRMGRHEGGAVEIPLSLTRQEVAEMVGTTVESAIRTLSRWGRSGLLITGEARFVIPSLDQLRAVAAGGEPIEPRGENPCAP